MKIYNPKQQYSPGELIFVENRRYEAVALPIGPNNIPEWVWTDVKMGLYLILKKETFKRVWLVGSNYILREPAKPITGFLALGEKTKYFLLPTLNGNSDWISDYDEI